MNPFLVKKISVLSKNSLATPAEENILSIIYSDGNIYDKQKKIEKYLISEQNHLATQY